jgi:hypothetical protein
LTLPVVVVTALVTAKAAVSAGVALTVMVCAAGALPPAWAENERVLPTSVVPLTSAVAHALVPVLGQTAVIVPWRPRTVATPAKVPVNMVYVPSLVPKGESSMAAEKGTGSGAGRVPGGNETVAWKAAFISPPSSLKVQLETLNVSGAPEVTLN